MDKLNPSPPQPQPQPTPNTPPTPWLSFLLTLCSITYAYGFRVGRFYLRVYLADRRRRRRRK